MTGVARHQPGGWARPVVAVAVVASLLGWAGPAGASGDVDGDGVADNVVDAESDTNGDDLADVFDVNGDGLLDDDKAMLWRRTHIFGDGDVPVEFLPTLDDGDGDGMPDVFDVDGDGIVDADKTGLWRASSDYHLPSVWAGGGEKWAPVPDELLAPRPSECTAWVPRNGECIPDADGDGLGDIYDVDGDGYLDPLPAWELFEYDNPNLAEVPGEYETPRPEWCTDAWSPVFGCWKEEQIGAIEGVVDSVDDVVDAALSAAGDIVVEGFEMVMRVAANGMLSTASYLADWMLGWVGEVTTPQFLSPTFIGEEGAYAMMGILGLQLLMVFGLLAIFHAMVTGGGPGKVLGVVKDAAVTVPLFFVAPAAASMVAGICDAAFVWLAGDPSVFLGQISAIKGDEWFGEFGAGVWMVFLMAPAIALAALVTFVSMSVVKVLALLAVAAAPLAFAARVWPPLKTASHTVVRAVFGLLLVKPVLGLFMRVGNNLSASALVDDLPWSQAVGQQVSASVVWMLMAFVPYLVFKLVPMAEMAMVGQGIASAPVRVMQQARSWGAGRGGAGRGNAAARSGGRSGTSPMRKGSVSGPPGSPDAPRPTVRPSAGPSTPSSGPPSRGAAGDGVAAADLARQAKRMMASTPPSSSSSGTPVSPATPPSPPSTVETSQEALRARPNMRARRTDGTRPDMAGADPGSAVATLAPPTPPAPSEPVPPLTRRSRPIWRTAPRR